MAAAGNPAYFESKRGEVNELRALLRSVNTGRDNKRKRDVVKKVIAYMTLGIDVSRLFSDMVLASNTKDLVVKKMVYLYLSTYARRNPDLTLLVINTLQKDCRDEDPLIRGLALRSLCSLRLPSIIEYVVRPLREALEDTSGYVRKTGVLGVLKVFHIAPEVVRDSDLVDVLYNMLRDRDAAVVVNCILALNELMAEEGGIAINQAIVHHLLNQIRDFSDWGQCIVIDLVAKYEVEAQEELFGIMNLLDPCLRVANSAVVMSTAKCFLALTKDAPEIRAQVYQRVKTPLLTLISTPSAEVIYTVLSHLRHLVERAPGVFDDEFKQFFCRFHEPTCVKLLKMEILPKIANEQNAGEIVAELTEYVSGVDASMARQAIRAIGEIAIRLPVGADAVIESLTELLEMDMDWVRSETVIVMRDLLRKYPDRASVAMPALQRSLRRMDDPTGRAAVIWMIGEYGQLMDDAPYMLEPIVDAVGDESSVEVQLELLTAAMKLFFKRPPEMRRMLGRLLQACLADGTDVSVHDRALLYYRLLRRDVREANTVIDGDREPVSEFLPEISDEVKERIFAEFNTLSMVYNKPAEDFIAQDYLFDARRRQRGASIGSGGEAAGPHGVIAGQGQGGADEDLLGPSFEQPRVQPTLGEETEDLLGGADREMEGGRAGGGGEEGEEEDDLLMGGGPAGGGAGGWMAATAPPAPRPAATLQLSRDAAMDPPTFRDKWTALAAELEREMRLSRPVESAEVEEACRARGIQPLASGQLGATLKFLLFAVEAPAAGQQAGSAHLLQLLVHPAERRAEVTVKSERTGGGESCFATLRTALHDAGLM